MKPVTFKWGTWKDARPIAALHISVSTCAMAVLCWKDDGCSSPLIVSMNVCCRAPKEQGKVH